MVLQPALLLHPPGVMEFNLAAVSNLPKNAVGLQSYSEFVKAACQPKACGDVVNQPVNDRAKPISIRGHSFRFVGVPIAESECSYQSDITSSFDHAAEESNRGSEAHEVSAPVPAWTPTASPAKSILRRSSVAPTQPPQTSPKQLVYDYASSASPASRRMSTVSYCASSKRTSAQHRRLSFDTGVQVRQPVEHSKAEYRQASVSARKVRSRRSSISSRRMSSASTCRPATYAGFEPFGLSEAGALLCESNGRKFLLVVDDVEPEEQVGTQCQPLDIDVEMDLLFEKLDEAGDEQSDGVMEVEQMRSAAVLPSSQCAPHVDLSSIKTGGESAQANVLPDSIPLISLSDLPATPGPSATSSRRHSEVPTERHETHSVNHAETGTSPVQPSTPHSIHTRSLAEEREASEGRKRKDAQSNRSSLRTPILIGKECSTESGELKEKQSICSPQQPNIAMNESLHREEMLATRKELQADAAVISGIDFDHDELVATTAHATRSRSSCALPVLASPQKTMSLENVPDPAVDNSAVSLPRSDHDLLLEVLEESEPAESDSLASVPPQSSQPPQSTGADGVCEQIGAQIAGNEEEKSDSLHGKDSDYVNTDNETEEIANSTGVDLATVPGPTNDSSTDATVPTSIAGNAEVATQAVASVSIAPASTDLEKHKECPNTQSKEVEAEPNARTEVIGNVNGIRVHTNVSQINIAPRVTAYQLAILQTLTPNTKATLAKIRGSKGPYAVQGVQVSPFNGAAPYRQKLSAISEDVGNVSKHERGTSITRSARDQESKTQHEPSSKTAKHSGTDLIESTGLGAECREQWTQVTATHFSPETAKEKPRHCSDVGGNSLSNSEPQQPEMLLRVPPCPPPVTPIERMHPEMELDEMEELSKDVDVGQLQDVKLASTTDFIGLMSPAPLAKRMLLDENEVINVDAEGSEHSLQVVAVRKMASRSAADSVITRSDSPKMPKSLENVPSVTVGDRSECQQTEAAKDASAVNVPTTEVQNDDDEAENPAFCEQMSNIGDCGEYEDFEDHGDEGFGIDDDAENGQDGHLDRCDNEISEVVSHTEAQSQRSKKISSPNGRKRSAPSDVLSSDTMDAPLKRSDGKEDVSHTEPSITSPYPSENPTSETSSPVIRRKSKRVATRKKASKKVEKSKNRGKRQWRELTHLPVGEVRIEDGPGPRRSKRQRFPRLKYWKNEVVSYERRNSQIMPTVSQVFVDIGDTDSEEAWMPRR
ncbi:hypothetical protein FGB62_5g258 [Gracilaria domingensis]|nr:hypothetical protein FGB62_5g258 [Gracilaria domingensis]